MCQASKVTSVIPEVGADIAVAASTRAECVTMRERLLRRRGTAAAGDVAGAGAQRPSVVYLLEDTPLAGGVKVVLHHANLLVELGHDVTVVSKGARPHWYPLKARFLQVEALTRETIPRADCTVATFWTTIMPAVESASGTVVHFCQGYEAWMTHNVDDHEAIKAAYRQPIPCWTVSPHLAELVAREFQRPVRVVTPGFEPTFRPGWRLGPHRRPRVLVMHPYEFYLKGVAVALAAVCALRRGGVRARVVRVSPLPIGVAERALLEPDEVHLGIPAPAVAEVMRSCDVLLAPSWACEGFGLPVLEAMACGLPVVASDIPSFRSLAGDAITYVPFDDVEEFAREAMRLVRSRSLWRQARGSGLEAVRRFTEERIAAELDEALDWAVHCDAEQSSCGGGT